MPPATGLLFSLLILLHQASPEPTPEDLNDNERAALITFIDHLPHHPSYNWDKSKPPCNTPWKGVECDPTNKTVWYLRLPAARLLGKLPENTFGKLTNLRVLSLHTNGLYGPIPSDFKTLTLQNLYLHNNYFSGELPEINVVDEIDVSNNELTGQIPNSLTKFPASAFSLNKLCGGPLRPCDETIHKPPSPPSPPPSEQPAEEKKSKKKKKNLVIGVSVGSGLVLLILLCCLRKKMYPESKQVVQKLSIEAPGPVVSETERDVKKNKLVSFDDGICNYDVGDLLGASAELLGKGSFGRTYKRVVDGKKTTVVLKQLKDGKVTKAEFESKMEVLGKMKNENVVPLRGYFYSGDEKWLVYEYMAAGSLSAHLHGSTGSSGARFQWNHRLSVALGVARGLAYLHADKVVHGNIKSSNVFLRSETNKYASVSEYGISTLFGWGSPPNHRITGYLAPEVFTTQNFSFKSDVYSFGVLLLELLTRKSPNKASSGELWNDFHMWAQSVVCEERKDDIFDVELRRDQNIQEMFHMLRITKDCVSILPHERPTMQEVVSLMEEIPRVETDDWLRQSFDDPSKGFDDTPSTDTRGTPSTITP